MRWVRVGRNVVAIGFILMRFSLLIVSKIFFHRIMGFLLLFQHYFQDALLLKLFKYY